MYIFNADRINLVVDVEALDILAVSLDHINELVHTVIITENDLGIVNSVLEG